jgi:photosystem II stability/assembly factor-like uncharacterized protein
MQPGGTATVKTSHAVIRAGLIAVLVVFVISATAAGRDGVLAFRVGKPVPIETLGSLGLGYLADTGAGIIVMGDANSARRMAAAGIAFDYLLGIQPGQDVFLLRGPGAVKASRLPAGFDSLALIEVAEDTYLAALDPHEATRLDGLRLERVRLLPGGFPRSGGDLPLRQPVGVDFNPTIQAMVNRVSGDSLWKYIAQLSGEEPVATASGMEILSTRYSLSEQFDLAAGFLKMTLERYGLDVEYDPYVVGQVAFYAAAFADASTGWVVGNDGAVYRTDNGGLAWDRRGITGIYNSLWGICFVDHDNGWACGTGGSIYRTRDGGENWSAQPTPSRVTLRDIGFADSLEGWVVGDGGEILQTADGGATWAEVESGTTADLYALELRSPERGWACGQNGDILFWDGVHWSPQAGGAGQHLMDVAFGDDDTGWVVGRGGTILWTSNGGLDWVPQAVPEGTNPFLNGVAALGASDGWVAGLNGTILVTHDRGETWSSLPTGTLFGLNRIWFDHYMRGWAVGYGSTVLYTDDGATWESKREHLPAEAILSLKNVVGTLPGSRSDEQVIICGHFDSISEDPLNRAPGADDNATGTAAVMEAARILSGGRFERTIKFICFSGEEQGLFGSGEYVSDPAHAGDDITGVVNFDMIGYADTLPEDIDIVGNPASEWLVDVAVECAGVYVPALEARRIIDPTMVYSDHASFWKGGHYAVLGIEDIDIPYPYYHTTGDTLGNLYQPFTTDVVRMGLAVVAHLARPDTAAPGPGQGSGVRITAALPNPFRVETGIRFSTGVSGEVEAGIVDVRGRRIRTLMNGYLPAGPHEAPWDGRDRSGGRMAPGIYFVVVQLGGSSAGRKVVLLK